MRDGEEVLKRVRVEVQVLKARYETSGGSAHFLAWAGREEYLADLAELAYLPEPHPPPPVIECDECEGKGFVWGNVQGPVKVDCADCNGLGYLYDPCFHCPAAECFYCENWPLGAPEMPFGADTLAPSGTPEARVVERALERIQYLGSLAESEEDVPY